MRSVYGENFDSIEMFEGFDLTNLERVREAVEGCDYVVHVASPVASARSKQIKPMEEVTQASMRAILEACGRNKVKKLIVTLSIANMSGNPYKPSGATYDHEDYAYEKSSKLQGYALSKNLQEHEIREFLKQNPQDL